MPETITLPTVLAIPLLAGLLVLFAWLNIAGDRQHAANKRLAREQGYDRRPLYRAASAWDGLMGWLMWAGFVAACVKVLQIFGS